MSATAKGAPRKRGISPKCLCGCGQAPATSCRQRKAECRWCGYVVRLSRECIARGLPSCPCGERMECQCLEDRMVAGDDAAYAELVAMDSKRFKPAPNVARRAQARCGGCKLFKRGAQDSQCEHCGYSPANGYRDPMPF